MILFLYLLFKRKKNIVKYILYLFVYKTTFLTLSAVYTMYIFLFKWYFSGGKISHRLAASQMTQRCETLSTVVVPDFLASNLHFENCSNCIIKKEPLNLEHFSAPVISVRAVRSYSNEGRGNVSSPTPGTDDIRSEHSRRGKSKGNITLRKQLNSISQL